MIKEKLGLKCLTCKDVISSEHRHDFVYCSCKECFVDGGDDYFRYGGGPYVMVKLFISENGIRLEEIE